MSVHAKSLQLCLTLCDPMDCSPPGSFVHGILQARILEWIAIPSSRGSSQPRDLTQSLPYCTWILYGLSHQESPGILEWVAYPFSSGSSPPRNWTCISCIMGEFFTNWATREVLVGPPLCLIPIESCKWTEQSIWVWLLHIYAYSFPCSRAASLDNNYVTS